MKRQVDQPVSRLVHSIVHGSDGGQVGVLDLLDSYAFIPVPSGTKEIAAFRGFITGQTWMHQDKAKSCIPIAPNGRGRAAAAKSPSPRKVA